MQACIIVQYPCLLHASCERLDLLRTESSSRISPSQLFCLSGRALNVIKDDSIDRID
jgi:hypothetical protein